MSRLEPCSKLKDEDWKKDGILIVCWLFEPTICIGIVGHRAVDSGVGGPRPSATMSNVHAVEAWAFAAEQRALWYVLV